MNPARLNSKELGFEENLGDAEPLVRNGDDVAVWELVRLLQGRGGGVIGHLLVKVEGHVAELFLDVAEDLPLVGVGQVVASLREDGRQVLAEVPAANFQPLDGIEIDGPCKGNGFRGDSILLRKLLPSMTGTARVTS